MKHYTIVLISLLLGACSLWKIPHVNPTIADISQVDKIGVVSLIGSKYAISYPGVWAWDNQVSFLDLPALDVDALVLSKAQKYAEKYSSVQVVPMASASDSLWGFYKNQDWMANGFMAQANLVDEIMPGPSEHCRRI